MGLYMGVGVRLGVGVGVIVGVGSTSVLVGVAVLEAVVSGSGLLLGVAVVVAVAVAVGDAVWVDVDVGVALATVGDTAARGVGVALLPQVAMQPAAIIRHRSTSNARLGPIHILSDMRGKSIICSLRHFPIQKVPKIASIRSSLAVCPVISPRALTAALTSMASRSMS